SYAALPYHSSVALSSDPRYLHSFPTRRSSDLLMLPPKMLYTRRTRSINCPDRSSAAIVFSNVGDAEDDAIFSVSSSCSFIPASRSEEHTSELQSRENLVCRLLLEKKKTHIQPL